jgi:hypothetical protein
MGMILGLSNCSMNTAKACVIKWNVGGILAEADGRNSRRDGEKCIMGTFMIRLLANY